jgi:hypothetical protein
MHINPSSSTTAPSSRAARREHVASEVYLRVERLLRTRHAEEGTPSAKIEEAIKRKAERLWTELKKRPSLGVLLSGGLGLGLASVVGAGEMVVAISAAYAAYLVLREGVPPVQAVEKTMVGKEH